MNTKVITGIGILTIIIICFGVYFLMTNKNTNTSPLKENPNISAQPTVENNFTIIAFGDSLTAGYGVPLQDSYPSILEAKLKEKGKLVSVINMGVSGETTSGGLDRVSFVADQQPSLVLLGLGANDMLRASPPSLAKANLEKILQALLSKNISVVLLGMQSTTSNGSAYKNEFDAIYPSLAKQYNIPLVPFFLEGVALRASLNTDDGIHPNRLGYEKIVEENILPTITPLIK